MRYVVKNGEDINSIAGKFQTDPSAIASMNYLDGDLRVGDVLEIPSGASPEMELSDTVPGYKHGKSVKKSYSLRPGEGQDIQAELMKSAGLPESLYSYPAATGLTVNPSAKYSPEIWQELKRIDAQRRKDIENMRKNYEQMLKHGMYDPYVQPYAMGGQVQPQPSGIQGFMVNEKKKQTPPILGQSMPNAGMLQANMGDIQDPDEKLTPQQYAQESASKKRLKKMSPPPMASGRPGRPTRPGEGAGGSGKGIQMLDQLWSSLAPQQVGFAEGGAVMGEGSPPDAPALEEAKQVYLDTLQTLRSESPIPEAPMGQAVQGMEQGPSLGMQGMPGAPAPMSSAIQAMGPGQPKPQEKPAVLPEVLAKPKEAPDPTGPGIGAIDLSKQKEESLDAVKTGIMAARAIRSNGNGSGLGGLL
jgi:hypothetical protein